MKSTFLENLDYALHEQAEREQIQPDRDVEALSREIKEKEAELQTLYHKMARHANGYCKQLAESVLEIHPELSVSFGNGKCVISHRDRKLIFQPNFQNKRWEIDHTQTGNAFERAYDKFPLDYIDKLAESIATFYARKYRVSHENVDLMSTINLGPAVKRKGMTGYGPGPHYE